MPPPLVPDPDSLPASVRLVDGDGKLPRLAVSTAACTAEVFPHGAHVARWQPAHANAPVLWLSDHSFWEDRKPIRGGVPICFPWFGPHPSSSGAPAHGFARLLDWTLVEARDSEDGSVSLIFVLEGEELSPLWPCRFRAAFSVSFGRTMTMALEIENRDVRPLTFEEALHTYFTVSDISQVTIAGLERSRYVDKAGGMTERAPDGSLVRFTGETDRVYLDTSATCVIDDPGLRRRIEVAKEHSRSTVVWNPWIAKARAMQDFGDEEWRGMVCVETANVAEAAVQLQPGERHRMAVSLAVESAS